MLETSTIMLKIYQLIFLCLPASRAYALSHAMWWRTGRVGVPVHVLSRKHYTYTSYQAQEDVDAFTQTKP